MIVKQLVPRFRWKAGLVFACLVFALTSACTTFRTHSDYDPQIRFDSFKTFAWAAHDVTVSGQGSLYVSPLDLQRIKRAIESELTTKGFQQLETSANADLLVEFTVGARDKIDVDRYPPSYRDRWVHHWPYYGDWVEIHSYTEGMLAIDFYDRRSGRPVWHGVARKRVTSSVSDDTGPLIRKAVTAILADFPPSS